MAKAAAPKGQQRVSREQRRAAGQATPERVPIISRHGNAVYRGSLCCICRKTVHAESVFSPKTDAERSTARHVARHCAASRLSLLNGITRATRAPSNTGCHQESDSQNRGCFGLSPRRRSICALRLPGAKITCSPAKRDRVADESSDTRAMAAVRVQSRLFRGSISPSRRARVHHRVFLVGRARNDRTPHEPDSMDARYSGDSASAAGADLLDRSRLG
jgi:hypothetical protein